MPAAGTERRCVRYTGTVQGVGFRYTAHRLAQTYAVTGYVRNLRDGSVEIVAEGAPAELDRFLAAVATTKARDIEGSEVQRQPPTGEYNAFEIAY
jgi:acylphosphatase